MFSLKRAANLTLNRVANKARKRANVESLKREANSPKRNIEGGRSEKSKGGNEREKRREAKASVSLNSPLNRFVENVGEGKRKKVVKRTGESSVLERRGERDRRRPRSVDRRIVLDAGINSYPRLEASEVAHHEAAPLSAHTPLPLGPKRYSHGIRQYHATHFWVTSPPGL